MTLKNMNVAPRCAQQRINHHSNIAGVASEVVNMRQAHDALVAVGTPQEIVQLPSSAQLLVADRREERVNYITSVGKTVSLYAFAIADGVAQVCNIPLCTLKGTPRRAVSVGQFVVIETSEGLEYLHYKGELRYALLDMSKAVPQLSFSAVETTTVSRKVAAYAFRNGYTRWSVPLDDEDVDALTSRLRDAYKRLWSDRVARGQWVNPIAVRYAVRMTDGSMLWASTPVVVSCGVQGVGKTTFHVSTTSSVFSGVEETSVETTAFSLAMSILSPSQAEWDALIDSIEVYIAEMPSPITSGDISYTCDTITSPSRYYFLKASLPSTDTSRLAHTLANAPQWRRLASISNLAKLRNGEVTGIGWRACTGYIESQCPTWCIENNSIDNFVVSNKEFAQVLSYCDTRLRPDAMASFDGILYCGGGDKVAVLRNTLAMALGSGIVSGNARAKVLVTCHSGSNIRDVAAEFAVDYSGISLGAMLAVNIPGARHIVVGIESGGDSFYAQFPLTVSPHGYSYYVTPDLMPIELSEGVMPIADMAAYEPLVDNTSSTLLASSHGNPFATASQRTFGNGAICAVIAPTKPVTANIFGRFPLYAFSTDGVYSVDTEKNSVKSRCIARLGVSDSESVAAGMDWVYFASGDSIYAVSGSNIKVVAHGVDVDALGYVQRHEELWSIAHNGEVTVWDKDGQNYRRTLLARHFDSSGMLVTATNMVVNPSTEVPVSGIKVSYTSMPFSIPLAPRIVQWHLHAAEAAVETSLHGSESLVCADRVLNTATLEGEVKTPLKLRLNAPHFTTLSISLTGTLTSGDALHPTTLWF